MTLSIRRRIARRFRDGVTATNANGRLRPALAACGIDEWVCAVDGTEESYRRYRVHGRFNPAVDFMRACVGARRAERRLIAAVDRTLAVLRSTVS